MPEKKPPGRGRRAAPPPRDILAGQVRTEDLPDVARAEAPAPPAQDIAAGQVRTEDLPDVARPEAPAPPAQETSAGAALVHDLARLVVEAGRLPLRATESALESQAQAIDDLVDRGAVPTVLVPGALVLKAELRLLMGMLRAVSGPKEGGS